MKKIFSTILYLCFFIFSCDVTENIQDGTTAFQLKKYALAVDLLEKEFNKEQLPEPKAKLALMIAQSYQFNNLYSESAKWYKIAIEWEYGSDALLAYAKILKADEKYEEAIVQFNAFLVEEPYRRPEIATEINMCESAIKMKSSQNDPYKKEYTISNLTQLNSPQADFQPILYKENSILFTSSRTLATGDQNDKWTTNKFYDIFQSEKNGFDQFSTPFLFSEIVNSPYNDGSIIFTKDGNELFFTRCGSTNKKIDDYCGLYYSYFQGDAGWSEPINLPFFEDSLNVGTPCLSPDEQALFFSASNQDGFGGSDLYLSKKIEGGWEAPVNLGQLINTAGNEVFPSFGSDGTFYFSSDGHPGIGGLDLFSAKFSNAKFSKIVNLPYPINSGGDDFGILVFDSNQFKNSDTLEVGYISSSRQGGKGNDDIYIFVKTEKKLKPAVYFVDIKISKKVYADSLNPQSNILDTIPLIGSIATISNPSLLTLLGKHTFKKPELISFEVDSNKTYKINGIKDPDYFTSTTIVNINNFKGKPGDTIHIPIEIILEKIFEKVEIALNNIYYDYNKKELRPESFPELDKLVQLLIENPSISIQLNSHTDSRGSDSYNLKLSQGRAQSVVDYLILKGIDIQRLTAKGWGETQLVNVCDDGVTCTEEQHQLNRRTTFKVQSERLKIESETPDEIRIDEAPKEIQSEIKKVD